MYIYYILKQFVPILKYLIHAYQTWEGWYKMKVLYRQAKTDLKIMKINRHWYQTKDNLIKK